MSIKPRHESEAARPPLLTPKGALLLIFIAIVFQAVVQGSMTSWISPADSMLFTALAFAFTTVIFSIVARIPEAQRTTVRLDIRTMVVMNIATAVTFLAFYASISMIPAATTSALESAFGPVAVAVLGFAFGRSRTSRSRWLVALALVVLGAALVGVTWDSGSAGALTVPGVLLAALAGWGMAAVTLLSHALGQAQVSPVVVTAHRFHASYLVAGLIWLFGGPELPQAGFVLTLLGLGLLATSIPLFLLQIGLQRAQPFAAMLVVTSLPALTFVVQVMSGMHAELTSLGLIVAIIVVSALGVLRK